MGLVGLIKAMGLWRLRANGTYKAKTYGTIKTCGNYGYGNVWAVVEVLKCKNNKIYKSMMLHPRLEISF